MLTLTTTGDLLITNQLLYQLSYSSIFHFGNALREYAMLTLTTTSDLLITNQLLYRLSYASIFYENRLFATPCLLDYHFFDFENSKSYLQSAPCCLRIGGSTG